MQIAQVPQWLRRVFARFVNATGWSVDDLVEVRLRPSDDLGTGRGLQSVKSLQCVLEGTVGACGKAASPARLEVSDDAIAFRVGEFPVEQGLQQRTKPHAFDAVSHFVQDCHVVAALGVSLPSYPDSVVDGRETPSGADSFRRPGLRHPRRTTGRISSGLADSVEDAAREQGCLTGDDWELLDR